MTDFDDWLRPRLRTLQIISLAIPAGAIFALAIMIYMRSGNNAAPNSMPVVSILATMMSGMQFALSFVLPKIIRDSGIKRLASSPAPTSANLFGLLQSGQIVGLALIEGAVMFVAIAYLLEGQAWVLTVALIGVIFMALRLPTEMSVLNWLDAAGRRLEEVRGGRA